MAIFEKLVPRQGEASLGLPVALLSVAFLLAIGLQTVQLVRQRDNLVSVYAGQEKAVEQTLRLRDSIDTFAGDTAKLAVAGDADARQLVEALHAQNIDVHAPAPAH